MSATKSAPATQTRGRAAAASGAARLRNVVLVGHSGAGKTTLAEAMLAQAGAIARAGRVEDGTTVCDHQPEEQAMGRSLGLAAATLEHAGVRITLLDTPGHPDLVGELRAGLRAADAALFVVSAVDGVDTTTTRLWEECAAVGMPRAVVLTHVDSPRADVDAAVAICRRVFGDGVQPLHLPLLDDDERPAGLVDLLALRVVDLSSGTRQERPADPEHEQAVQEARAALIEGIIAESEDDTLLDRYLAGEDVEESTLVADLETAVARGSFHPVMPVLASTGLGVPEVLDLVARGFPAPPERPAPSVTTPDGEPWDTLSCDPQGPLVAEVVKTVTDPYVGRLSLVRVFSGTLLPDTTLHVCGHVSRFGGDAESHPDHDLEERAGAVSLPLGGSLSAVPRAEAGEVVAVARLAHAETADTLSLPSAPALVEPWLLPDPLLPVAVAARTATDEDKLASALSRLCAEDLTVRVVVDPGTGQVVLWTMGELHRDVLLGRLRTRTGVEVVTEPVRVALRETVVGPGSGTGRNVKQSGGHGQYAVCDVEVAPLPPGSGIEFEDAVVGGAVPRQYIGSVEKGVRAQAAKGLDSGFPLVDLRVRLVGGKAHSVDSSDAAFATAGALALKEAVAAAGTCLLEPVETVTVVVGDEYVGAVLGDLAVRRARVTGTDAVGGGRSQVRAEVPAGELTSYATDLRSIGHGTGSFTREPAGYTPVPAHLSQRVLAATR